jgi:hypothetical protein
VELAEIDVCLYLIRSWNQWIGNGFRSELIISTFGWPSQDPIFRFLGVALPLVTKGQFPAYGYIFAAIFLSFILGDLIAIPFGYLLGKGSNNIDI